LATTRIAASAPARLAGPEFLSYAIDEEFHTTTPGTDINVKVFPIGEQFSQFPQNTPSSPFVKALGPDKIELVVTAGTGHWIHRIPPYSSYNS
jgi:hypothetical protein